MRSAELSMIGLENLLLKETRTVNMFSTMQKKALKASENTWFTEKTVNFCSLPQAITFPGFEIPLACIH